MLTVASQNPEGVILLDNVRKTYQLSSSALGPLRRALRLATPRLHDSHNAVDGVSLKIAKGESVGILGVNGAGKSTLLQMITGTLTPTSGSVRTTGRIAALLELGAGFNPHWTGRKNAEFQCVLQGVSGDILQERIAAIEAFADIGHYFDEPARTYSSGMYIRVAFASSIANDPDILIVDEALAVGDLKFQNKCFRRFEELQRRGCTVLFVTHSPDLVTRFCSRGLILHAGRLRFDGSTAEAARIYMNITTGASLHPTDADAALEHKADEAAGEAAARLPEAMIERQDWTASLTSRPHYNSHELRSGNGRAKIVDAVLHLGDRLDLARPIRPGEELHLTLRIAASSPITEPETGIIIRSKTNQILTGATNDHVNAPLPSLQAGTEIDITWTFKANFLAGDYFIDLGVSDLDSGDRQVADLRQSALHFTVSTHQKTFGLIDAALRIAETQPVNQTAPATTP